MKPHHFGVYKDIPTYKSKPIIIPEASLVIEDLNIFEIIQSKSISRFGDDIEYSCDLIMTDKTLPYDLKNLDCYLLLIAAMEPFIDKNTSYWDPDFSMSEYTLLGWMISDYNGENYAFCDGLFPVQGGEKGEIDQYELNTLDKNSINEWGLLKTMVHLKKYLMKNRKIRIQNSNSSAPSECLTIDWKGFGIFCDEFTLKKLQTKWNQK